MRARAAAARNRPAPAASLAKLPPGFKGPTPQDLDVSLLSKLDKLDSIVDQDPSGVRQPRGRGRGTRASRARAGAWVGGGGGVEMNAGGRI